MQLSWRIIGIVSAFVVLLLLVLPTSAIAQYSGGYASSHPVGGSLIAARDCVNTPPAGIGISPDEWKKKYSVRAVYCMYTNIRSTTEGMIRVMLTYAGPAFMAAVTFALIIFMIKVIGGGIPSEKLLGETMMMLMKAGLLIFFIQESSVLLIADVFYNMSESLLTLLTNSIDGVFFHIGNYCDVSGSAMGNLESWYILWEKFDCIFGDVVGLGTIENAKKGITWIVGASFFTGTIGFMMFVMAIAMFIAFLRFMFHCVTTVIFAYGAMGLLLIVFPLFLPLIFFKITSKFFWDGWLKMMSAQIVKPAFTLFFFVFGLAILEPIVYEGSANTFVNYDRTTNTVEIYTGSSAPMSGSTKAIMSIFEPIAVDYTESPDVQNVQYRRNIKENQRLLNFEFTGDSKFFQGLTRYCGELGEHILGSDSILTGVARSVAALPTLLIDPERGEELLNSGIWGTTKNTVKASFKFALCNIGLVSHAAPFVAHGINEVGNTVMGLFPMDVDKLDLSRGETIAGVNGLGSEELHAKRMMQMIAAIAALFLMNSAFISFAGKINSISSTVAGAATQNSDVTGSQDFTKKAQKAISGVVDKIRQKGKGLAEKYNMVSMAKTGGDKLRNAIKNATTRSKRRR